MDADLYDEFGNYIGPNILSDEEIEDDIDSVEEKEEDEKGDDVHESQFLEHPDEALAVTVILIFLFNIITWAINCFSISSRWFCMMTKNIIPVRWKCMDLMLKHWFKRKMPNL